ncbi:hypothetical protein STAFG_8053 [Streptomyces afghaniensis 772]|uniref:Uncharacterized protein n=1 Tax=Streptomyces afghaniensis 772 TaxID=1283301 RepID=S4M6N7_9ACTN|nr:hypothetical protein STAFG_8053 [Streptomyces afghaniensis 772]
MAGGLHPAPGLVVGEAVVQLDGPLQGREGEVVVAPAVFELSVQHGRRDGEDVAAGVVEQHPRLGHQAHRRAEQLAFGLRPGDFAGGGEGDAARVVAHGGGHRVELRVGGSGQVEDVGPAAEADQYVDAHGEEALEPVGHRGALHAEQVFGDGGFQLGGGVEGDLCLAEEHGPVDLEVVVVRPVEGVEVHRAGPPVELLVGGDRVAVGRDDPAVVAAQDVEVRGHVVQVPGVGHDAAQPVGDGEGLFRCRGHLHQVDVEVQHPGVPHTGVGPERAVQHGLGLQGPCALGGLPGRQVPQLPGGEVHQGVGVQGRDVRVFGRQFIHRAHGVRVRLVPHRAVLDGLRLRVAGSQRADQSLLDRGGPDGLLMGSFHCGMRTLHRPRQFLAVEEFPGLVVVRAQRVGDAPIRHRALGISLGRLFEAGDGFLVMEGVRPHQAAVEPELGLGKGGGDGTAVRAEVVIVAHGFLLGKRPGAVRIAVADAPSITDEFSYFQMSGASLSGGRTPGGRPLRRWSGPAVRGS